MNTTRTLHCCSCGGNVHARLTSGVEIYPHRLDLAALPYWKCGGCGNHVGCHHKTENPTEPLGAIPSPEIRRVRREIHQVIDPLWKTGRIARGELYGMLAHVLGINRYHTAEITEINQARDALRVAKELRPSI